MPVRTPINYVTGVCVKIDIILWKAYNYSPAIQVLLTPPERTVFIDTTDQSHVILTVYRLPITCQTQYTTVFVIHSG